MIWQIFSVISRYRKEVGVAHFSVKIRRLYLRNLVFAREFSKEKRAACYILKKVQNRDISKSTTDSTYSFQKHLVDQNLSVRSCLGLVNMYKNYGLLSDYPISQA